MVDECPGCCYTPLTLTFIQVEAEMTEQFTLFWAGPFSQWHSSVFSDPETGTRYVNAEQYMMHQKALLFGDHKIARQIMRESHPREIKKLGRQVVNFNKGRWDKVARDIVYRGNQLKFTQNPHLRERLFATRGTTLVEASPYDRIWGIGRARRDPRALDRRTWRGTNWLGEVLTRLRDAMIPDFGG